MYPKTEFKFPTVLGLILIGLIIGGFTIVSPDNLIQYVGRARTSTSALPEHIRVSNISDTSLVVSWTTEIPSQGEVRYRTESLAEQVAYDIRDSEDLIPKAYKTHYVEINNLTPGTLVEYDIYTSGVGTYSGTTTTGPPIATTIQELPIYGEFVGSGNSASSGTMIFATIGGSAVWSTFISDSTNWVIPVARVRTGSLDNLYCISEVCQDQTRVSLEFYGEEGAISFTTALSTARPVQILSYTEETTNDQQAAKEFPTPFVVDIGDMLQSDGETDSRVKSAATSIPQQSPSRSPSVKKSGDKELPVTILNPKQDAKLSFPKPLIRGQGVPGQKVTITLNSAVTQIGEVTVGADGTWHWTPAYPLEPGLHTITVETNNSTGKKITLSNTFHILKSGQQVLQASTASASLTPTNSPTPSTGTSSPTASPSASLSVTLSPSATMTPTVTPTATSTPSPTIRLSPSITMTPTPTMFVSGGFIPSVLVIAGGASLILLAFALL